MEEEYNVEKSILEWRTRDYKFQQFVKQQEEKVCNRFINPQHPLVIQHAAVLDLIKQYMVIIKYRSFDSKSPYETEDPETLFPNEFALNTCSIQKLEQFETEHGLHLPNELKVYLMEIGEGGTGFFCYGGLYLYKLAGKLQLKDPVIQEPCLYLGRSWDENQLYVISGGVHEGEVWVHTQTEGGSRDHFTPASPQKFALLSFIAESLLIRCMRHNTPFPYKGAWL